MRPITLRELPQYSPWPARLRDAGRLPTRPKTPENLYNEYNDDKYAKLLSSPTIADALERYWGAGEEEVAWSRHGELFVGSRREAHEIRNKLLLESLRPLLDKVSCVVELGAGFGQVAHLIAQAYPNLAYRAGEFTPNGVVLGNRLLPQIQFEHFDLYAPIWDIFNGVENALVLTVHTVEMLPDAGLFAAKISSYSKHIRSIVAFEPVYEDDGTELCALRRAYIEANGYCRNILQSVPGAQIEKDFFGLNPLFPESRLEWRPQH